MNYNDSGVNISTGNNFIKNITGLIEKTNSSRVLSTLGGYCGYYDISNSFIKNPVLVSSTDGVGSKLNLAAKFNQYDTVGIDLVAMIVNDLIVSGCNPLFFLDYYGVGKLDLSIGYEIIKGIVEGCKQAEISLLGGETAELRTTYHDTDFDLVGFGVGIIDKYKIITPELVNDNDAIIGIMSSGPHSNGYSLINKIFENETDTNIIAQLLEPTKIYVKSIKRLMEVVDVHGLAHITGGGITENLPRILPNNLSGVIKLGSWIVPEIFNLIQNRGSIEDEEMRRVFNCGVGMIVIVDQNDVNETLKILSSCGETVCLIGYTSRMMNDSRVFYI